MSLKKLFGAAEYGKAMQDRLIEHGYRQTDLARHLKLHYSTVSRLIKGVNEQQR